MWQKKDLPLDKGEIIHNGEDNPFYLVKQHKKAGITASHSNVDIYYLSV